MPRLQSPKIVIHYPPGITKAYGVDVGNREIAEGILELVESGFSDKKNIALVLVKALNNLPEYIGRSVNQPSWKFEGLY